MIAYLQHFFANATALQWVGTLLAVTVVSLCFRVSFHYAHYRNLRWMILIEIIYVLILLLLALLKVDNFAFYLYISIVIMVVCNIVFFAQDISRDLFRRAWINYYKNTNTKTVGREELGKTVDNIVRACQNLSKSDTGALIIIADIISDSVLDSGTDVDAVVSSELLETIFHNKTPLHDGAVVINSAKIVSAGCYLPLTQRVDLPREFGTRHRAAMGITDANPNITAIVVSEESGIISAMRDGVIKRYLDAESLRKVLEVALHLLSQEQCDKVWGGKGIL